jgi:hypothetical protein
LSLNEYGELSVIMLNAIMLSVKVPLSKASIHYVTIEKFFFKVPRHSVSRPLS